MTGGGAEVVVVVVVVGLVVVVVGLVVVVVVVVGDVVVGYVGHVKVGIGNGFHGGKTVGTPGIGGTSGIGTAGTSPGPTTGGATGGATGTLLGTAGIWLGRIRGIAGAAGCGDTTAAGNATGSASCGTTGR
jgi:hypothetical protein